MLYLDQEESGLHGTQGASISTDTPGALQHL